MSISNSVKRNVQRYSLGSISRLRKIHKGAEKSVTNVKRRPDKIGRKYTTAHKTAMHSRSVAPRRESVRDHLWLEKATTVSDPSFSRVRAAPAPSALAFWCKQNGLSHIEKARMGKDVRADMRDKNACWCCSDHGIGARLARLDTKALLRSISVKGTASKL